MLVILFLGTIVYAFLGKDRKHFWLWCALLLALLANSSENMADLDNYTAVYNSVIFGDQYSLRFGVSKGWYYLCILFNTLGFTYRGLQVFVIIVSCYLCHRFVRSIDCKRSVFWGLFIVFPGLLQIIQLRFFLGTAIVIWALGPLVRKERRGVVKFIIGVVFSSCFHTSCLFYIILLLVVLYEIIDIKKAILVTALGTALVFGLRSYVPRIIINYIPRAKYERYFISSLSKTTLLDFALILLTWLVSVVVSYFCKKKMDQIKTEETLTETSFNSIISPRIVKCIALLAISLPLLVFDMNFFRYFELGYCLLYIFVARLWKYWHISRKSKLLYLSVFLGMVLLITDYYTPFGTVIKPLFSWSGFHSLL